MDARSTFKFAVAMAATASFIPWCVEAAPNTDSLATAATPPSIQTVVAQNETPQPPQNPDQVDQQVDPEDEDVLPYQQGQSAGFGDDEDEVLDPRDFEDMTNGPGKQ